jgi:hypothetical protein
MGMILELVEKMRSPVGIVITIVVVAAGIFFVRWVFSDEEKK